MNIAKQFPIKVLCYDFIQLDYSIGSNYSVKRTSDLEFVTLQQIILDSPNKNVSFAKILIIRCVSLTLGFIKYELESGNELMRNVYIKVKLLIHVFTEDYFESENNFFKNTIFLL